MLNEVSENLHRIRHSLAHVLAQAVQKYRPGTKLGFGPAISDGFYYDFLLSEPISDEDLPAIQKLMVEIIKEGQEFSSEELAIPDAIARLGEMGEPYKAEYAQELADKNGLESLTFYTNGPFVDMCEGPHVETTRNIPRNAFKLHNIAGAYWRGDEKNQMLTRIYGWAFEDKKQLRTYQHAREEAVKRDHRKLGAELDLFIIDDHVGPGLPLWLPNGAVIIDELQKLGEEFEFIDGYQRVHTPMLTKGSLYEISGHLELYKEAMFPAMKLGGEDEDGEEYYLRPMNCPHHHILFASRPRSYRDLPFRMAEYGHTFRNERSGSLHGLSRVRAMCMNDAHIYCTKEQVREEFVRVLDLHKRYYDLLELDNYFFRLSMWDPDDPKGKEKYIDDPAGWEYATNEIREAMKESNLPYREVKGEAAFYGPKVDVQFLTVGLKEFTVSTTQLDFGIPQRFVDNGIDCTYIDSEGKKQVPFVIHRAPLSTHERFASFLIERYGGAMPTWLAPVQVKLLPVGAEFCEYANKVCAELRKNFIRAEVDLSSDTLGKKIRQGTVRKIPNLLVLGANEVEAESVTVRRYGIKEQRNYSIAEFTARLLTEIKERKHVKVWEDADALME
ncbi:MAG: threonine--tRNA ligase [Kofleriaceae bacterium]|nr:threonine--tRNA ligase [Kofleriaceae bacterium]